MDSFASSLYLVEVPFTKSLERTSLGNFGWRMKSHRASSSDLWFEDGATKYDF